MKVKKAQYQTRQMAELLSYLQSMEGKHITVNDIKAYFNEQGITMGTATIYRHLERMVEEGIVAKYTVDGTTSACFEYHGGRKKGTAPSCYHCKCERCGKLIHMHCDEITHLEKHLLKEHGFEINSLRTVFYGLCQDCRKKEALEAMAEKEKNSEK